MSYNPFSLEGKTVLVTGASSGIGQATAIECAKMGAKVVITGRNVERLQETFSQLEGEGHLQIAADLNSEDEIAKLVEQCPVLNGLVNNAGRGKSKPVNFIGLQDLQDVYQTNLFGVALLTKMLLKKKKIAKGGSIVFTSSISAYITAAGLSIYASSKAAVAAYMRTCAIELGPKGIRANAILPGMVETKLINSGTYTDEDKQNDLALYPLGRYGRPEDIARAMVFLLSDASAWMTGTELVVDGGRCLK
ncbi:MAG: SDR family oxidoreductase [Bacteroidales bacterium]|nr:SDR family oxidoreductase [Bacteroidales bacterium]MBR6226992.1 SDR family oxidoreductase [Bacteroidales bacterium]